MPANLPPQYFEAEQQFRAAKTPEAKVEALEEMLAIMPKHKGTDKLRAMLRERISKFRDQAQQKKGGTKQKSVYNIEKEGAAQIVILGPPNTGKSSLVKLITNALPEIASFPHTTHKPTTGMAIYENIQFQFIDTPPLTRDFIDPAFMDLVRRTDIIVLMVDLTADAMGQCEEVLSILHEFRIYSPSCSLPLELKKAPYIKPMLITANKLDSAADEEIMEIFRELTDITMPCLGVSAKIGRNIPTFLDHIFSISGIIRVYTKPPGKEADKTAPFVIPVGSTVEDLAGMIHKDFLLKLKYAKMWGKMVRDGQMAPRHHLLHDGDIVEFCL